MLVSIAFPFSFWGGAGMRPFTSGGDFVDSAFRVVGFSTSVRFVVLRSGVIRRVLGEGCRCDAASV